MIGGWRGGGGCAGGILGDGECEQGRVAGDYSDAFAEKLRTGLWVLMRGSRHWRGYIELGW